MSVRDRVAGYVGVHERPPVNPIRDRRARVRAALPGLVLGLGLIVVGVLVPIDWLRFGPIGAGAGIVVENLVLLARGHRLGDRVRTNSPTAPR